MRIGLLTGGGDCPGLNPALRGFVMRALDYQYECVGFLNGWKGLVDGASRPLGLADVEDIVIQGGTMLGSSRTNPFKAGREDDLEKVLANIKKFELDAVVAFGGEDTLGVAHKLFKIGVPTVGVPKTMDNDLDYTDFTFGFDSAVSVATESIDRLRDTAKSHNRVMVVEVMGRHAGWVALYAGIAGGADWVLLPEIALDLEAMCQHLLEVRARGKNYSIVVASEGVDLPHADETDVSVDAFGHVILRERGVGEFLAKEIEERTGIETRFAVLGHIQRGGAPTVFDRVLASRLGIKAADLVHEKKFGMMASIEGNKIIYVELAKAVDQLKTVPLELYEEAKVLFSK
jgi:ATP-dependent phosphofructokinase / diphosphate-dependent phosphofructokinase